MPDADAVAFSCQVKESCQVLPGGPAYTVVRVGTVLVLYPMPPAGVKILFLLGWMDVVAGRSRQVVVLAM